MDFQTVVKILKQAKQEVIDRKKCFVVDWDSLQYLFGQLQDTELVPDERLSAEGYTNFKFILTAGDKGVYYIASKSGPILDEIWREKQ